MNPKVAEHWNEALQSFDKAVSAYKNGLPANSFKGLLYASVWHADHAMEAYWKGKNEASIATEDLYAVNRMLDGVRPDREFIVRTFNALKKIRDLVPEPDFLPEPKMELE